jgi:hypothetical protein
LRSAVCRALLAATLPLALAACGLDADEADAANSLSAALGGEDEDECVAEKWIGQLGTGPLVADGVLNEDLEARRPLVTRLLQGSGTVSEEVAEAYAAAWISCVDLDELALERNEGSGASAEEIDEYADCLKEIDDDEWRQALADEWSGRSESSASIGLARDLDDCEKEVE